MPLAVALTHAIMADSKNNCRNEQMKIKSIRGIKGFGSKEPEPTIGTAIILLGDVLEVLRGKPANSFDAIFCDPPYGISFMGREWDHGVPSAEVWKEILRVLKPGGFLLAFGGTRMWHHLALNIENGGFEIKDALMWLHGQGFPKGLDISKGVDEDNSEKWEGYKTALKPAWEPIIVAMKPLDGTYAANALKHGVAGFNIDGSRIGQSKDVPSSVSRTSGSSLSGSVDGSLRKETGSEDGRNPNIGRYPANLILQHTEECVLSGTKKVRNNGGIPQTSVTKPKVAFGDFKERAEPTYYFNPEDGTETVNNWICHPECPVRQLDEQTGISESRQGKPRKGKSGDGWGMSHTGSEYSDKGGASRFFYNAKASKSEREEGLEPTEDGERANNHPTVKPIDLNRYFAHLILPPKRDEPRKMLVPFSGVGSEVIGALLGGWDHVTGIEIDPDYARISRERIHHWRKKEC
jgi:DNA modification methylase